MTGSIIYIMKYNNMIAYFIEQTLVLLHNKIIVYSCSYRVAARVPAAAPVQWYVHRKPFIFRNGRELVGHNNNNINIMKNYEKIKNVPSPVRVAYCAHITYMYNII